MNFISVNSNEGFKLPMKWIFSYIFFYSALVGVVCYTSPQLGESYLVCQNRAKLTELWLSDCLTNDTKFSDLSVFRTKIYDYKLVYFFGTPGRSRVLKVYDEKSRKFVRNETAFSKIVKSLDLKGTSGRKKVKLKWKSVKNAKQRAVTDLNAPNGSRDIPFQSQEFEQYGRRHFVDF